MSVCDACIFMKKIVNFNNSNVNYCLDAQYKFKDAFPTNKQYYPYKILALLVAFMRIITR